MKDFEPWKRNTILSVAGKTNHLHIICTEPFFNKETGEMSVLAVNISSVREGSPYDDTCILHAGDHPFVKHDSYVRYRDAVAMRVSRIRFAIETQEISVLDRLDDDIFPKLLGDFKNQSKQKQKLRKCLRASFDFFWPFYSSRRACALRCSLLIIKFRFKPINLFSCWKICESQFS